MRKIYLVIVGAVLLGAAILLVPNLGNQRNSVAAQDTQTATIERTTLYTSIESTGTIEPEQALHLTFEFAGIVSQVDVEVGDTVQAGDVLATLDTSDLVYQVSLKEQALIVQQAAYDELIAPPTSAQISQAEANLLSAQSQLQSAITSQTNLANQTTINCANLETNRLNLESAQADYNAYVEQGYEWDATFVPDTNSQLGRALRSAQSAYDVVLAQCSSVTPNEDQEAKVTAAQAAVIQAQANLDALHEGPSQEDIDAAQARVAQAQLDLDNARTNLLNATITAPFDGLITAVNVSNRERVTSTTIAITLVDVTQLHVDVDLDERDVPLVQVGQEALLTTDALPDVPINGTVARIAPAGDSVDGIVTYKTRVNLDSANQLALRIGMTTNVEIVIAAAENVLVVPTSAIQRSGTTEFIVVTNPNDTTSNITVTTGQTNGGLTVIEGDVTPGQQVIIPQTGNGR